MKIPAATPLIVSFLSGGLARSVFTYVMNHRDTVMTYRVTTESAEPTQRLPQGPFTSPVGWFIRTQLARNPRRLL
jgi:hypothetical protein